MAELIPYSYSDHVISPFLLFYEKRIVLFFSSSYLKTGKTASLLLLFFSYEIAVFRQRTSGTFSVRICTFGKQNVEKQVTMLYYVDICVILCKDPVKEMKHGELSGGKRDACNRTTGTDRKPDQEERSSSDSRTHKAVWCVS